MRVFVHTSRPEKILNRSSPMEDSWLDDAAGTRRLIMARNTRTTIPQHDERCTNTQWDHLGSAARRALCAKRAEFIHPSRTIRPLRKIRVSTSPCESFNISTQPPSHWTRIRTTAPPSLRFRQTNTHQKGNVHEGSQTFLKSPICRPTQAPGSSKRILHQRLYEPRSRDVRCSQTARRILLRRGIR